MPKIDTLDAVNDETTSMLKTLTHSLSFSGSKRYIYIGGNKSFGAHTAESLCFQWEQIYCIKHKRSQTTAALTILILTATAPKKDLFNKLHDFSCLHIFLRNFSDRFVSRDISSPVLDLLKCVHASWSLEILVFGDTGNILTARL